MAPLREKLAQETIFESGNIIDSRTIKAVTCAANACALGLLRNPNLRSVFREKLKLLTDDRSAQHKKLNYAIDCVERAAVASPPTTEEEDGECRNTDLKEAENIFLQAAKEHKWKANIATSIAHLYLSLIYKLRENANKVAVHLLDMFIVNPYDARATFAPGLWEQIFLPRFSAALNTWHEKEVSGILSQHKRDHVGQLSPTRRPPYSLEALYTDFRGIWQTTSTTPTPKTRGSVEREQRLEAVGKLYQESLDENTRKFAEFYKSSVLNRKKSKRTKKDAECYPALLMPPQLRLHIVQRQILSRKSLWKEANCEDQLPGDGKENSRPAENMLRVHFKSDRTGNNSFKKLLLSDFFEANTKSDTSNNMSVLDGSELEESRLLRVWGGGDCEKKQESSERFCFSTASATTSTTNSGIEDDCSPATKPLDACWEEEMTAVCESFREDSDISRNASLLKRFVRKWRKTTKRARFQSGELLQGTYKELKGSPEVKIPEIPALVTALRDPERRNILDEGMNIPKVVMLEKMVTGLEDSTSVRNGKAVIAADGVSCVMECLLNSESEEEKASALGVLLCCMQADDEGESRRYISHKISSSPLLLSQLLLLQHSNSLKMVSVRFMNEVLRLNKRLAITTVLERLKLKHDGFMNCKHVLLSYLAKAPTKHRPSVASLLLQVELLDNPKRQSMYREEAVAALVGALNRKENLENRICAANVLMALSGSFARSGKSTLEFTLLKSAGFMDLSIDHDNDDDDDVENGAASNIWSERVCTSILREAKGEVFDALGSAMGENIRELATPCMVSATWLCCGCCDPAIQCEAYDHLVGWMKSTVRAGSKQNERVLASLCLHSFSKNSVVAEQMRNISDEIIEPLTQLKYITWTADELLHLLYRKVNKCLV